MDWFPTVMAIPDTIAILLGAIPVIYGSVKGSLELRERYLDARSKMAGNPFRVKTTVLKFIIHKDQTEIIKLRTLRVYKPLDTLSGLDLLPAIETAGSPKSRPAQVNRHYSIPGYTRLAPGGKLEVRLSEQHAFAAHRDHALVVGFNMIERMSDLYDPSWVSAKPLGSDSLRIEVYFPRGWRLTPDSIQVYGKREHNKPRVEVARQRVFITSSNFDFGDDEGDIDFFQVEVKQPPKDLEIYVEWQWRQQVEAPSPRSESARAATS